MKIKQIKQTNFVAWAHERTTPSERPPLVGEDSANFCIWEALKY
jgi:hypothetical protein